MTRPTALLLILPLLFAGCASTDKPQPEIVLSQAKQQSFLANAKHPAEFGFDVYRTEDGIGCRGTARLHPNHLAGVELKHGHLPVIDMTGRARRQKMKVLVDTMSPNSWMELSTAQEMKASFLGVGNHSIPYRGNYDTGRVAAYAAVVPQMRIDQLFIESIPLYVRMAMNSLGPLARGIGTPTVDAAMGYDILRLFEYVQFDFVHGAINFSATIPYVPHEDLVMAEAKIVPVNHFGLAVEGAVDGETKGILLDFAGDYEFARGDAKVGTTRQVDLGGVVFVHVPTLVMPIHNAPPRAGRRLLEKYIVTVCPQKGVVYFERPPEE